MQRARYLVRCEQRTRTQRHVGCIADCVRGERKEGNDVNTHKDYVTETGTGDYCIMYWVSEHNAYVQSIKTYPSRAAATRALARDR